MTRVVPIDAEAPDAAILADAADLLRRGGLVAIPTETVYGLAGRALDRTAIERIFAAKGRPTSHPLIAHVETIGQARELAASWPDAAERLAARFFPGPLTLVVPRSESVPSELAAGGSTVAVRAPAHPVARGLIRALGEPIAAPSANRYQSVSPTEAAHVVRSLGDRVDLVLDAGPTRLGIESSVVDVTATPPRLLRPGSLAISDIRAIVPDLVVDEMQLARAGEVRASPGLDARHYAPRAHVELVEGQDGALRRGEELRAKGKRVSVILRAPIRRSIASQAGLSIVILGETPEAFGAQLFSEFHRADAAGANVIVVEDVPVTEPWFAIRDRLRRARA